jgi:predicted Zn-dependent protease
VGSPDVSACLIVKDAAASLPRCVESIRDLVREVVVVDTGSRDATASRAETLGCRVFPFPWTDDFAAARNESLRHATGRWALWIDADEHLDEPNRRKLRDLLARLPDAGAAYAMTQRSLLPNGSPLDLQHTRLFRNYPDIRFCYRVHEQVAPAVLLLGHTIHSTDIVIQHAGYHDPQVQRGKLERNARLLELDLQQRPDDAYVLLNLATAHADLGRPQQAVDLLRRTIGRASLDYATGRAAHAALVQCHLRLGQTDAAWAVCVEGRRRYPGDVPLLYWQAQLQRAQGDLAGAEHSLLELVRADAGQSLGALDLGLIQYLAPHLLGQVVAAQGRVGEAEKQWRAIVAEQPAYMPAWQALAELYLTQQRWADLDAVLGPFEATAAWADDGAVLRARRHLAQKEFAGARTILGQLIARAPEALAPRFYLTHVLMAEGKDWPAAERALRDLLRLDPHQGQAFHNLAIVLSRLNRPQEALAVCETGLKQCPGDPHLTQLHAAMRAGH